MKEMLIVLLLSSLMLIYGCSDDSSPVDQEPSPEELEAIVIQNSLRVIQAAEAFAAENDGSYPQSVSSDTTLTGNTLIDFLPDGILLINPYTKDRTEPRDMTLEEDEVCEIIDYGLNRGETGYVPYGGFSDHPVCYLVCGHGADSLIIEVSNVDEVEDIVISNCLIVMAAVEEFASQNRGVYPDDINRDTTPAGDTVIDFLPEHVLLINPFTTLPTEPQNGWVNTPGETGYVANYAIGVTNGYIVMGVGRCAGLRIFIDGKIP